MSETKQKPNTEDEPDTFAELAERIAVVTSPYEQLYQYKGIQPTETAVASARLRQLHEPLLYKIGDPFDPNCARTHWEKYRKKAMELGATANELPAKTNCPFYDLIQLGKFCSARASRQKKDENESKVVRFTFKPPHGAFPNNSKAGDTSGGKIGNRSIDSQNNHEDIVMLKPNFYGIGLDINALIRKKKRGLK